MLIDCTNEKEWLKKRLQYLAASESASYCGVNPYEPDGMIRLWEEKTGLRERADISGKASVAFGKKAEEHIRAIFMLRHPEYELEYHQFGLYVSDEYPFMAATLDGLLHNKLDGTEATLEIKTATVQNGKGLDVWRTGELPIHYWTQEIHQQVCKPTTGTWTVALVMLNWDPNTSYFFEIFHDRSEFAEDMPKLIDCAKEMHRLITTKTRPSTVIRL